MQTGDARIVDALDVAAENLQRDGRFLGDREIGGARRHDCDRKFKFGQRLALDR